MIDLSAQHHFPSPTSRTITRGQNASHARSSILASWKRSGSRLMKKAEFTGPTRAEARLRAARWWVSQKGKGYRKISEVAYALDGEPLPENVFRWTVVILYEEL